MSEIKFNVQKEVSRKDVLNLIVTALEGGSNYWYEITEVIEPIEIEPTGDEFMDTHRIYKAPINKGGALKIADNEDETYNGLLNIESIQKGLQLMAEQYPNHFNDFVKEEYDAETADVFLQLAVFGEIVFG